MYILICGQDTLYCGITTDVRRRLDEHNSGKGSKYTAAHLPCDIVAAWQYKNRSAASVAEANFKKQTRDQKLAAVRTRKWRLGEWVEDPEQSLYTILGELEMQL